MKLNDESRKEFWKHLGVAIRSNDFETDHEAEVLLRAERIALRADGVYMFTVERHPGMFGQPTLGASSSAFVNINQIWELDPKAATLNMVDELYAGDFLDEGACFDNDVCGGSELISEILSKNKKNSWK